MKSVKTSAAEEEIIQQGMFYCPYGRENYQCFFLWLQKRSMNDKMKWYQSLTNRDKKELIACHSHCKSGRPMILNKLKFFQTN